MNRRDFIKGSAAVVALAAMPKILKAEGNAKMKILVLTGSPRKNGNSATLADNFIKGAEEAGHTVVRFDAAFKKVHPCIACNKCGMDGPCIFKDDFDFVRENIVDADAVVFATPMYYFGISAQLKAGLLRKLHSLYCLLCTHRSMDTPSCSSFQMLQAEDSAWVPELYTERLIPFLKKSGSSHTEMLTVVKKSTSSLPRERK